MVKCIWLYCIAAGFSGASWWAYIFAQTGPQQAAHKTVSWVELIQLGGTGGLIVSLLGAVVTLWKERKDLKSEIKQEREHLLGIINGMREDHKEYLEKIQTKHEQEVDSLHQKYTSELKAQIELLRNQTHQQFRDEREKSDTEYRHQS